MTRRLFISALMLSAATACANPADTGTGETRVAALRGAASPAVASASNAAAVLAPEKLPSMVVHKSASCGCCGLWVEHMRKAGFQVEVRNEDDLVPIKKRVGVPYGKGACHTAEVGGYFVEGHVPAEDVKRLLAQRPAAKGLVLPGMPMGSPGMEVPDGGTKPYTVELVDRQGATIAFAAH